MKNDYEDEETLLFVQADARHLNESNDATTHIALAPDSMRKMKVSELKDELQKHSLLKTGKKKKSLDRLLEAVTNNAPVKSNVTN